MLERRPLSTLVLAAFLLSVAGPVWAHRSFAMRDAPKSSLYRYEVTEAAVEAVLEAVGKIERCERPESLQQPWMPLLMPKKGLGMQKKKLPKRQMRQRKN